MEKQIYDLIIVGAGPAGLTASLYAVRYNLKTFVIGEVVGGQVAEVGYIENYPGFIEASGLQLSKLWFEHAKKLGAESVSDKVINIRIDAINRAYTFEIKTAKGEIYYSKTIMLASGTQPRRLNVPGEKEFFGKGVSYCFTCDAPFFKGKTVGIVGGGDSAVTGALALAEIAKKVYVIHRRDEFRAKPGLVEELKSKKNVQFIVPAEVKEVRGNLAVEELVLEVGGEEQFVEADGLFIEVGSEPATELSKQLGLELRNPGFVKVYEDMSTDLQGVYAAGDISTGSNGVRQIVCAMSEGAIAAQSIFKYLKGRKNAA